MNHILHLNENCLAKEIQAIQEKLDLPSLTKECKTLIKELNLTDIFKEKIKKRTWKRLVKKKILDENEKEIKIKC